MKVIDLLNKIANGEEIPLKIKVKGYEYRKSNGQFWCDETEMYLIDNCTSIHHLNDEIEIIEKDKKIEKIKYINTDYHLKELYYENLSKEEISLDIQTLKNKINEIIDYLEENKND